MRFHCVDRVSRRKAISNLAEDLQATQTGGSALIERGEGQMHGHGGASTPMKMCIQADLSGTGAHMNKNNSERPVYRTHPLAPVEEVYQKR